MATVAGRPRSTLLRSAISTGYRYYLAMIGIGLLHHLRLYACLAMKSGCCRKVCFATIVGVVTTGVPRYEADRGEPGLRVLSRPVIRQCGFFAGELFKNRQAWTEKNTYIVNL